MKKQVTKKKRNQKLKKKLASMTAIVLVLAVGVWGTMAYLSKKTGPTTNTFTGSAGLKLGLTEPNWENSNDTAKDGGKSKAENYTPDLVIAKNPILYNADASKVTIDGTYPNKSAAVTVDASYKYNEYVAMRIDFTDGNNQAITYGALLNVIKPINFDTNNWKLVKILKDETGSDIKWSNATTGDTLGKTDGNGTITEPSTNVKNAKGMIFVYKGSDLTTLAANSATSALFTQIQIREGTSNEAIKPLNSTLPTEKPDDHTYPDTVSKDGTTLIGGFPDFKIIVKGAAVDTGSYDGNTGHELSQAETDLVSLLTTN